MEVKRRPEGAGGQGEQRGGENFLEEQKIIHSHPLFTFVYTPSTVELEEDPPPNQLYFANIFF